MKVKIAITVGLLLAWEIMAGQMAGGQDVVIEIKQNQDKQKPPFAGFKPNVDVAILLDTSNSMDGLINQAKNQLWTIVEQFSQAKKQGQTPTLRVAVLEYGNTKLPASEGYIRQVTGLTDDLDVVSEALFGLSTQGGDEYCGQVINEAVDRLDWSSEPNSYKAIFIAGNEPFTQGGVDYKDACGKAIQGGIIVNTIHCGHYNAGLAGMWKDGAERAEGEYMNIDQDEAVVSIKTPQDKILIELNSKLNKTYLWYGAKPIRQQYCENQNAQDENAAKAAAGLSSRAAIKAGKLYSNFGRDLIDTYSSNKKILEEIDESDLPESLAKVTPEKREAAIQEISRQRKAIQKEIAKTNQSRLKYIQSHKEKAPKSKESTLGDAVTSAIRKQLKQSGFEFGGK